MRRPLMASRRFGRGFRALAAALLVAGVGASAPAALVKVQKQVVQTQPRNGQSKGSASGRLRHLFLNRSLADVPATPSALLAQSTALDRRVDGVQDARYLRAGDIRPGDFVATIATLTPEGTPSFVFEPASNWGRYRYRLSVIERKPAAREPEPLPAAGKVRLATLRWQDLGRLTEQHQPRLRGTIESVAHGGKTLIGSFRFAGEDIRARLSLLDRQPGGPQPAATWRNIPYGPHWHQTIDVYPARLTPEAAPAALVIAIHGGGWGALDKDNTFGLQATLPDRGIHFASINYRFIHTAPGHGIEPAVRMPLEDAARAVQTLRWLAGPLRIDPEAVGAIGGSAGAFTALWLALHEDMAEGWSPDPISRQSTQPQAVVGIDAQTSLDPRQMRAWIPGIDYGAHAFGIYDEAGRAAAFERWLSQRAQWLPWIRRLSPYALASPEAPPIYLGYPHRALAPAPGEQGWATHAPQFGVHLHRRLQALGTESYLHFKGSPDPRYGGDYEAFLVDVLMR